MSKTHKHHVVPVHLGGKDGPIQVVTQVEHATIHANRFLNGEDSWFHGSLCKFLDPELDVKVREHMSVTNRGENHPNFGKKRWTDGEIDVISFECPPGFYHGVSEKLKSNLSKTNTGQVWWNNGIEEKNSHTQPKGFIRGRLPRKRQTTTLLDTETGETLDFDSCQECYEFLKVTKNVFFNRKRKREPVHNRYLIRGKNQ